MSPLEDFVQKMSRRRALGLLGTAGAAAGLSACGWNSLDTPSPTAPTPAGICILSPALEESPFFIDERLNRSDLTAGTSNPFVTTGLPLALTVTVVKFGLNGCTVLPGAQVDIWHVNAAGRYSDELDEGTLGDQYLRGFQITDANGVANFKTIYPGWYNGRAVHIHAMIRMVTPAGIQILKYETQMFFDPTVTASVCLGSPYNSHGNPDTINSSDHLYAAGGSQTLIKLTQMSTGFAGSVTIGVQG